MTLPCPGSISFAYASKSQTGPGMRKPLHLPLKHLRHFVVSSLHLPRGACLLEFDYKQFAKCSSSPVQPKEGVKAITVSSITLLGWTGCWEAEWVGGRSDSAWEGGCFSSWLEWLLCIWDPWQVTEPQWPLAFSSLTRDAESGLGTAGKLISSRELWIAVWSTMEGMMKNSVSTKWERAVNYWCLPSVIEFSG